jgi:hypothetical protein
MMETGVWAEAVAVILGFHIPVLTSASDDGREDAETPLLVRDNGQSAQGTPDPLPGGDDLAEYLAKLKLGRMWFEVLFLGSALLDMIVNGAGLLTKNDPTVEFNSCVNVSLTLLVQGLRGGIAWYWGHRLHLPRAMWMGLATCIPGTFWPTLFTIRGWRPVTFSDHAPASVQQIGGKLEPWVKGWTTAFAVLLVIRSLWMSASYVPYFSPLLGRWAWVMLIVVWLMLYLAGFIGLYRWYWQGQGNNGWHFGVTVGLLGMGYVTGLFALFFVKAISQL